MVGTITLNPCIDKTLTINGFTYGGMNRVEKKRADVSGKGVNVSIALNQIGSNVRTFGINYKDGAEVLNRELGMFGITYEGVVAQGTLRENMKVYDIESNLTTELNQKGDYIDEKKLDEFTKYLEIAMKDIDILVVTGSVPQGVPMDYYYQIIQIAHEKGVCCILDAEGELMLEGMKANPYLIKPNLYEFESAFGLKTKKIEDILEICHRIIANGVEVVCLSMGEDGAIIVNSKEAYRCQPTSIDVKSTQGAGDSLVAGMCMAIEEGLGIRDMLRYGVATAQGSLIREGTQLCRKEDFQHFKETITVEKL
ncbi:MAG: 1-phosphofructokinase family hexose kinase [Lachnospiraceae bacterium]